MTASTIAFYVDGRSQGFSYVTRRAYTWLLELKLGLIETMKWVVDPHEPREEELRKMRLETPA
jgi:hypothetical protein